MPWSQTSPMDQRVQFIADYLRGMLSMVELCASYGISRKTGYKWIDRYLRDGPEGLEDQSRRPERNPNQTPAKIEAAFIQARQRHPTWGAKKLLTLLTRRHPGWPWPSRTTVCNILRRNGLVVGKKRRRVIGHPGRPTTEAAAANELWCADYKGQFKTGNGIYCYPLTVTDTYSRYIIGCQGLAGTKFKDAQTVFTRLFKEYGLPRRIRTDNGTPFASYSLARLSRLSAWWVRLGVIPEFIEPGKPQQNGKHERMHRTLKAETTKPPARNLQAQQRKFNRFVTEFNHVRPHEALDMATPASLYQPSNREMPTKLVRFEYPDRFVTRYVSGNGGFRWHHQWVCVSMACVGEYLGLEEIDNGIWNVYFGPLKLGRFHERLLRIEDQYGRLRRRRK